MKEYIHARLGPEDREILESLKHSTGVPESELVRQGLRSLLKSLERSPSALETAGLSAGKFADGPRDLSRNKKHLKGFGE
jgi:hypothetical protein